MVKIYTYAALMHPVNSNADKIVGGVYVCTTEYPLAEIGGYLMELHPNHSVSAQTLAINEIPKGKIESWLTDLS